MTWASAFENPVREMKNAAPANTNVNKMMRCDFINPSSFLYFVIFGSQDGFANLNNILLIY
jgi:hypothetical protein